MTRVKLIDGMNFVGAGESNHAVIMDTVAKVGGDDSAPRPVELMLIALGGCSKSLFGYYTPRGGCTGMDTISILRKMQTIPTEFSIELEDERAAEHPKVLTRLRLVYRFKGDLPEENVKKAIELSINRYCPITNMINKVAEVSWEYVIETDQ